MSSWMDRLQQSSVDWLIEKACPPVLHRLYAEVLERAPESPEVAIAREGAFNYKSAVTISRSQQETGTWLNKVLEFEVPNASRNRGPGLVNQFLALVEYGWDRTHPIIHCSAERLLRYAMQDTTADLFELKGYVGSNEVAVARVREDLSVIAAAVLSRAGYTDDPIVVGVAERVLDDLKEQYPADGPARLFDGTLEIAEESKEDGVYRIIRPGAHVPDMFLYYLMAFHPHFHEPEAREVVSRVTRHLMQGDEIPLRLRQAAGKRYLKLVDLHVGGWGREEFGAGRLGFLLHDLELLARTGTLLDSPRAVELLEWVLTLQSEEGIFRVDDQIEKVVSRSQYHYFPLEESWRGKHKKYTDVTFRVLLILRLLDKSSS